ncbi:MAG: hypothetical protein ACR2OH_08980, partial [Microthrixaceae bacterium]
MLTFEVEDPRAAIFLDPRESTDPVKWHEIAAELRRDNPVFRVEHELMSPFYAITRNEDVFEISRRNDIW